MKYMGSKRSMLSNSLGEILSRELPGAKRFADLFVGSGAVAWHVSQNFKCKVLAGDLQRFAVVLAGAVVGRDHALDPGVLWEDWSKEARRKMREFTFYEEARRFDLVSWNRARRRNVELARDICIGTMQPITRAYGGYYFSPMQALQFDALRLALPDRRTERTATLAALICAASECAASPGHTAQPFRPTKSAGPFLFEAWHRDVFEHVRAALTRISPMYAQVPGRAAVCDAASLAGQLGDGDVAFIDPPYSGVHYSRFYHVLETITGGENVPVSGAGRYPPRSKRPKSDFSIKSKSRDALDELLSTLAQRGVRSILTFPKEKTSNGLSGAIAEEVASKYFIVSKTVANGRFSTLGGNKKNRKARIPAFEVILVLHPRN